MYIAYSSTYIHRFHSEYININKTNTFRNVLLSLLPKCQPIFEKALFLFLLLSLTRPTTLLLTANR